MPDSAASTRVVWALRRAFLRVESRKEELMRGQEVSPSQYAVLMNVHRSPGITGAALARLLRVSPQNISVITTALAGRGLLEKRENDHHPQTLELHLTRAGVDALEEADAVVTQLERDLRTHLGPADTKALTALLDRIADWD